MRRFNFVYPALLPTIIFCACKKQAENATMPSTDRYESGMNYRKIKFEGGVIECWSDGAVVDPGAPISVTVRVPPTLNDVVLPVRMRLLLDSMAVREDSRECLFTKIDRPGILQYDVATQQVRRIQFEHFEGAEAHIVNVCNNYEPNLDVPTHPLSVGTYQLQVLVTLNGKDWLLDGIEIEVRRIPR